MTDDDAATEPDAEGPDPAPSVPEQLLELQRLDTEADQLTTRRERLPEREQLAHATEQLATWERRRSEMSARIDELATAMETAETRGAALRADKSRLEGQLKTVIAPREAEALLHEIATADEQLDSLDTGELADLSEMTTIEEQLEAHLREEETLRGDVVDADAALARAVADIDAELAVIDGRREPLRAALAPELLSRYDRVRGQLGVAVARLVGHRCAGCHLDLSAAEVDTAKEEAAAGGITDCPQCGRMLVV